jgi:hypothetical protein
MINSDEIVILVTATENIRCGDALAVDRGDLTVRRRISGDTEPGATAAEDILAGDRVAIAANNLAWIRKDDG